MGRERREGGRRRAGCCPPPSHGLAGDAAGNDRWGSAGRGLPISSSEVQASLSIKLALIHASPTLTLLVGGSLSDQWALSFSPGPDWQPHQDLCPSKFWIPCIWQRCEHHLPTFHCPVAAKAQGRALVTPIARPHSWPKTDLEFTCSGENSC